MSEREQIIDGIKEAARKVLPPPIGTQTIPTENGTREFLAMLVLLAVLKEEGGG